MSSDLNVADARLDFLEAVAECFDQARAAPKFHDLVSVGEQTDH